MNIRAFFKSTNRNTLEVTEFGVGDLTSQKAFTEFMIKLVKTMNEYPELQIEFKIKNLNYKENEK